MNSIGPDAPLVTAVALCYNHSRFVAQCLDSVLEQTYRNIEVFIVDDCSRDDSPRIVEDWLRAHRLDWRFIRHQNNLGICKTLNEVVRLARGDYFCMIATDDLWLPDKVERQVGIMEHLPASVGWVYSDAFQIDEAGNPLPRMFIESHRAFSRMPEGGIELVLWEANFIPAMTTLIRRRCYDVVGLYDEDLFFEDWDMWLRMARRFEAAYCPVPSAKYRVVGTSMVRSAWDRMVDSACRMCLKHLRHGNLSVQARRAALAQLSRQALLSYDARSARHKSNLLHAVVSEPSIRLLGAFLAATCGLSFNACRTAGRLLRGGRGASPQAPAESSGAVRRLG
ncbi:MAG: glycosyltransferase [Limisphaerales bacterium]